MGKLAPAGFECEDTADSEVEQQNQEMLERPNRKMRPTVKNPTVKAKQLSERVIYRKIRNEAIK